LFQRDEQRRQLQRGCFNEYEMKHAIVVIVVLAPWVVGIVAVARIAGWDVLTSRDIRSQAASR
jgi:hypothetical protein